LYIFKYPQYKVPYTMLLNTSFLRNYFAMLLIVSSIIKFMLIDSVNLDSQIKCW